MDSRVVISSYFIPSSWGIIIKYSTEMRPSHELWYSVRWYHHIQWSLKDEYVLYRRSDMVLSFVPCGMSCTQSRPKMVLVKEIRPKMVLVISRFARFKISWYMDAVHPLKASNLSRSPSLLTKMSVKLPQSPEFSRAQIGEENRVPHGTLSHFVALKLMCHMSSVSNLWRLMIFSE